VIQRLAPALLLGVAVSLGLFWLMHFMITQNSASMENRETLKRIEFVRLKRVAPPPGKKKRLRKPEKVEVVKEPPKKPPPKKKILKKPKLQKKAPKKKLSRPVNKRVVPAKTPRTKAAGSGAPIRAQKSLTHEGGLRAKPAGTARAKAAAKPRSSVPSRVKASRGLVPLVRVPPKYPRRAAQRGVEGWVKVQFVITVAGRVKDAKVVGSSPSGVFDRAALKAISKWKFKAKVIKGQRVEQIAIQTLQFKLKKRRR
jgi:periplasmic protein TonB